MTSLEEAVRKLKETMTVGMSRQAYQTQDGQRFMPTHGQLPVVIPEANRSCWECGQEKGLT